MAFSSLPKSSEFDVPAKNAGKPVSTFSSISSSSLIFSKAIFMVWLPLIWPFCSASSSNSISSAVILGSSTAFFASSLANSTILGLISELRTGTASDTEPGLASGSASARGASVIWSTLLEGAKNCISLRPFFGSFFLTSKPPISAMSLSRMVSLRR